MGNELKKTDYGLRITDYGICTHCLGKVNSEDAIYDEIDGKKLIFCCTGCNAIYRLIHEQGLDEFYEKRLGWRPGRPEIKEVSEEEFTEYIKHVSENHQELEFIISGIRCASCIWLIEHLIKKSEGVMDIRVNYATHRARLRWNPERINLKDLLNKITSLGYTPKPAYTTEGEDELRREKRDLLIRFGTASFFSMQLMIYTSALYAGYFQGIEEAYRRLFQLIAWALATPVMFYCGYPFMRNAMRGLKNRTLNMDVLIFLGSFSAYAYSIAVIILNFLKPSALSLQPHKAEVYFDTSSMIITLILLGRFIEQGAKIKAFSVIQALLGLQPKEARLIRDSEEIMVKINELKEGDRIIIKPGERIPVDGLVIEGSSEVEESMLTGESMPVVKGAGSQVFAGTINLNGRIIVDVRAVKNTVLSKITEAVLEAQSRRARIQGIADRVTGWFVPFIILTGLFTFIYWSIKSNSTEALMNAVSVLVIACPCALGLATPLAILTGSTRLYSSGIIIKEGNVIEQIAHADTVCIDKTGTLTEGRPELLEIIAYDRKVEELHIIAASLEQASEHVIARAITKAVKKDKLIPVRDFQSFSGLGVKGIVGEDKIIIGNMRFLQDSGVIINEKQKGDFLNYSEKGYTIIGIAINNALSGWLIISDRVAQGAVDVINELKRLKKRVILLTGDQKRVAIEVGKGLGIEDIHAEVLPAQKAEIIRRLKASNKNHLQPSALSLKPRKKVMMVGDGINDAPALTEADAGIATGGATDIAMESAGAVLMRNDIGLLIPLIKISKKTLSIIKQNLFWAFSYNIIAIPLAVSGRIHPIISAILMATSSLIVVGNSLRLRR